MGIRADKNYDQHAHDQQTQASPWAAESGEDYAAEVLAGSQAGPAPWYQSYDAQAARPNMPPSGPRGEYAAPSYDQMASDRMNASPPKHDGPWGDDRRSDRLPSDTNAGGFNEMTAEQHAARDKSGAGYVSKRKRPEYASYYAEQNKHDADQERRMA